MTNKKHIIMSNEETEVIVDQNNEEGTEVEETHEDVETTDSEEKVERREETPQAKKARLDRQQDQLRKKHPELYETTSKKESKKSNGLDYGEKAYLTSNGIKGAKEFEFVESELKKSGESLDELLDNDYFKARLEKFRGLEKTAQATISSKRSSSVATDSVDYWMEKPFEEVPQDMRAKVVQAKIDKEKNKGHFYNSK